MQIFYGGTPIINAQYLPSPQYLVIFPLSPNTQYYLHYRYRTASTTGPWTPYWYFTTTSIRSINSNIPSAFKLFDNYPNPFNPTTKIRYELPKNGLVKLVVYDILGKEIETLVNEKQSLGTYEATFNAAQYPSGIYIYKLATDGFSETKKMLYVK